MVLICANATPSVSTLHAWQAEMVTWWQSKIVGSKKQKNDEIKLFYTLDMHTSVTEFEFS